MQLLEIEFVKSPAWVIARRVCAIHTISIHAEVTVHCILQERRSE
jgi:hypothetical protein